VEEHFPGTQHNLIHLCQRGVVQWQITEQRRGGEGATDGLRHGITSIELRLILSSTSQLNGCFLFSNCLLKRDLDLRFAALFGVHPDQAESLQG
jgi:hypothetical protein